MPPACQSLRRPKPSELSFGGAVRLALRRTALLDRDRDALLGALDGLAGVARACELPRGQELLSRSSAGDAVDPRHDALYVVARGRINVRHDPQQSTGGRLLVDARPRTRRAVAFRLAELGPGSIIGGEELATRRRSVGVFLAMEPCYLYSVSFERIDALAADEPLLYAAVYRFIAAVLCDDGEAMKARVAATVDALYSKPLRAPVPRATLRAMAAAG